MWSWFAFTWLLVILAIFKVFFLSFVFLLLICPFRSFPHFKNWIGCYLVVKFSEFLYIMDINPLSDEYFANVFSHSADCVFILKLFPLLWRNFLFWCNPVYLFLTLFSVFWDCCGTVRVISVLVSCWRIPTHKGTMSKARFSESEKAPLQPRGGWTAREKWPEELANAGSFTHRVVLWLAHFWEVSTDLISQEEVQN